MHDATFIYERPLGSEKDFQEGKIVLVKTRASRIKILHYHLFKNAGTSVDTILKSNFQGAWQAREFSGVHRSDVPAAVQSWLAEELGATAYSSHYADVRIMPMLGFKLLFLVGIAVKGYSEAA